MSEYNFFDGDIEDGIVYNVVEGISSNFSRDADAYCWKNYVNLKGGAMHIAGKVVFNSRANKMTGFAHDAFEIDVLMTKFKASTMDSHNQSEISEDSEPADKDDTDEHENESLRDVCGIVDSSSKIDRIPFFELMHSCTCAVLLFIVEIICIINNT